MKRRLFFLTAFSLLAVLLAAGCVRAAAPRGWAQPVQAGDLLLVSAHTGKLDAIDPTTGDRKWRFPDDWSISDRKAQKLLGIYGKPIVMGDNVFVADYNGFIYAFKQSEATTDKANKKRAGIYKVQGAIIGGMAVDSSKSTLFVTSDDGRLYALNVSKIDSGDPNVFPPFQAGDRIWTAPVVSGNRVYFATTAGKLFALDTTTGKEVWDRPFTTDSALVSTPVVAGDVVLAGGFGNRLFAVDAASGTEKWEFAATDWIWSTPLVEGNRVYVGDFAGKVFALSLADGKPIWDAPFDSGSIVRSGPALSGGSLVVGVDNGNVYGVDTATGKQAWGPVRVGSKLQADLLASSGSTVFLAPTGCLGQKPDNAYYYKLNSSTQERGSTGSVC